MLVFGHAGITLGAVIIVQKVIRKKSGAGNSPAQPASPFYTFVNGIDFRVLLVGSLLPDIIDKPLGLVILRNSISAGRIYAHTLFSLILTTLGGIILYRSRRQKWLLVLAIGTLSHLILDTMWLEPFVLFWPLYGWSFTRQDTSEYFAHLAQDFTTHPDVFLGEIAGFIVAVVVGVMLLRKRKRLRDFLITGRLT